MRSRPARLAAYSAVSAAASRARASVGPVWAATPALTVSRRVRRRRDRAADALGERERGVRAGAGQRDDELLAAPAGGGVGGADVVGDDGADHRERAVAGLVALLVVDALEVVQVERDDREREVVARGAGGLGDEALLEPAAVQQAGERVGAGLGDERRDEAVDALGQRADHRADDRHRRDDVDPAVEVPHAGRHRDQRDPVDDADPGDDEDRPAAPVEVRHPQDGPHVHHGPVRPSARAVQRVGDHHRAERPEQAEDVARQARAEDGGERRDDERDEPGKQRRGRPARDQFLDEADEHRAGVDAGGAAGDRPRLCLCWTHRPGDRPQRRCLDVAGRRVSGTRHARRPRGPAGVVALPCVGAQAPISR